MKNFFKSIISLATIALCACSSDDSNTPPPDGGIIGLDMKAEPKISYCLPRYISDQETRTIWEVFTGEEMNYGHITLRTQPNKRAGMYFFVMFGFEADEISLASEIKISVSTTDNPQMRTFSFVIPQTQSVLRELRLGITGKDWQNPQAKVNAWKIEVKSPAGKILTQKQSWLWSSVEKNNTEVQKQSEPEKK